VATAHKNKIKAAAAAGLVTLVAAFGMLGGGGPAGADVNAAAGNAYGASATLGGLSIISPTAFVSGSASVPATGYPLKTASAIPVAIDDIISLGVANAGTQASGLGTHAGTVISNASVASVRIGAGSITADAITSSCTANGDGATGHVEIVNATAGGSPLITTPVANTVINVPGVATITLNEEIPYPDPHTPGVEDLVVNGLHAQVLPGITGPSLLDVVLAHSECHVAGPDVNEVPTTTPTSAPPTSGPTSAPPTSGGPTSAPPTSGGPNTTSAGVSTTQGGGAIIEGGTSSQTTIAVVAGGIVSGVLARTGALLSNAMVWAILVLFLGGLALLGGRGEVQTWPPKRRTGPKKVPKSRFGRRPEDRRML
jgi:hypothetical protein